MKKSENLKNENEQAQYDSSEYDSDNYDDEDSFIQNEDDEEDDDIFSENEAKSLSIKKSPKKKKKAKRAPIQKEENDENDENIKMLGKKKKRLTKLKEKTPIQNQNINSKQNPLVNEDNEDDFLDDDSLNYNKQHESIDDDLEVNEQIPKPKTHYNHELLDDIFNPSQFEEHEIVEEQDEGNETEEINQLYKTLNPEEQKKLMLTKKDQEMNKKDIPERLQMKFEQRKDFSEEHLVHEAKWIVKKLLLKKNLPDTYLTKLQVKVYSVLDNLVSKSHEIMYIWMYLRHEITSNRKGSLHFDQNEELSLDDLWTIYFLDEEWQKCSELKISCNKFMQLLETKMSFDPTTRQVLESSHNLEHLMISYEFLKFKLKAFMTEEEIEELFKDPSQKNTDYGKLII